MRSMIATFRPVVLMSLVCLIFAGVLGGQTPDPVPLKNWTAPPFYQPSPVVQQERSVFTADREARPMAPMTPLLSFVGVAPCRIMDSRPEYNFPNPFGPPTLQAGEIRTVPIPFHPTCGIPAAQAYSLNITVVPRPWLGFLTIWPTGQTRPNVSTLNALDGQITANAAIVPSGTSGSVNVYVLNASDVIIDINGYYVQSDVSNAAGTNSNVAFNLNPGTPGTPITPHPYESDSGWNGGAQPQQLIDGYRGCVSGNCGLAFTGGTGSYGGQACGVRQATINLGTSTVQVSAVRITHHLLEHVPTIYQIQTWNGSAWVTQVSITDNVQGRCATPPAYYPVIGATCTITDEFPPVQATKVRYTFDNCPANNSNVIGGEVTHGWLWEFEAYRLPW